MRLINAKKLALEEFAEKSIPPYAILSHRWEDGQEVSFAAFGRTSAKRLRGWAKIKSFCKLSLSLGYAYCWVDTCCIDKSSSAELSESINSMNKWYQSAEVCVVYMNDVEILDGFDEEEFKQSEWFTRGWTLQELLAPGHEWFYDMNWSLIGSKEQLKESISEATGIGTTYLFSSEEELSVAEKLSLASVAKRMSWASRRTTSRSEDIAYCLLGLFDINMPLLYGEGEEKAFRRLQLEILKTSDDQTIFAWNSLEVQRTGIIAKSPKDFSGSGSIDTFMVSPRRPYDMTNLGLRMQVRLFRYLPLGPQAHEIFVLPLNCFHDFGQPVEERNPITIFLIQHFFNQRRFCRVGRYWSHPPKTSELLDMQEVFFVTDINLESQYAGYWHGFVELQARDPVPETFLTRYWSSLLEPGAWNHPIFELFKKFREFQEASDHFLLKSFEVGSSYPLNPDAR